MISIGLITSNIMINQKQIRALLRKTEDKFISKTSLTRILQIDRKKATELLAYLQEQGDRKSVV